jgi:hypothetical protein
MAKSGGKAMARGDKLGKGKKGHGGHNEKKLTKKKAKNKGGVHLAKVGNPKGK